MSTERYFNVWLPDIGERVVMAPSATAVKNYILDRLAEKELFSYGPASLKDVVAYLQSGENRLVDLMPTDKTAKVLPTRSHSEPGKPLQDRQPRGRGRPPKVQEQPPKETPTPEAKETPEAQYNWDEDEII